FGVAQGRALVDPGQEGGPLPWCQAPVIGEMTEARVGMPGGHPAVLDDLGDRARPPTSVVVAQERERAGLARPMARLALLLDDGRDVRRIRDGTDANRA